MLCTGSTGDARPDDGPTKGDDMATINIGRVRHNTSDTVNREVERYINSTPTVNISSGTAAAIAAGFQSPAAADEPFLLLAQGSSVDKTDLRHAIHREIESDNYDEPTTDSLYALLQWALDN